MHIVPIDKKAHACSISEWLEKGENVAPERVNGKRSANPLVIAIMFENKGYDEKVGKFKESYTPAQHKTVSLLIACFSCFFPSLLDEGGVKIKRLSDINEGVAATMSDDTLKAIRVY